MLNETQQAILNACIGPQAPITNDLSVNEITKVEYLHRAITQENRAFLASLDRLYQPELVGEAKAHHLKFIESLKAMSDLYWNTPIRRGPGASSGAQIAYFFPDLMGVPDRHPPDFASFQADLQQAIQDIVIQKMAALPVNNNMALQINNEPNTGWRVELCLPVHQLTPEIEHQLLGIQRNAQLFSPYDNTPITRLHHQAGITLPMFLTLTAPVQIALLKSSELIVQAVNNDHLPIADLLAVPEPLIVPLIENAARIAPLLLALNTTIGNLVNVLPSDQVAQRQIIRNPTAVLALIENLHINLSDLRTISGPTLALLVQYSNNAAILVNQKKVAFHDLIRFSTTQGPNFLEYCLRDPNSIQVSQMLLLLGEREKDSNSSNELRHENSPEGDPDQGDNHKKRKL